MKKYSWMFVAAAFSLPALADKDRTITINETGFAKAPAEFATITVSARSVCYSSPKDARKGANVVINQAKAVFENLIGPKTKAENPRASHGPANQQDYIVRYKRVPRTRGGGFDNVPEYLCKKGKDAGWTTTSSIRFKVLAKKFDKMVDLYDGLTLVVGSAQMGVKSAPESVLATLQQPMGDVFEAKKEELRKAAKTNAIRRVRETFRILTTECGFRNVQIANVTISGAGVQQPPLRRAYSKEMDGAARGGIGQSGPQTSTTGFYFGDARRQATAHFTFTHEGGEFGGAKCGLPKGHK